jgi:hypothetical protein
MAAGGVLGSLAASDYSAAEKDPALCPGKVCSPEGRAKVNEGDTKALASTYTFIGGGAALAAGIVLFALSAKSTPKTGRSTKIHFMAWAGPPGGGAGVTGGF